MLEYQICGLWYYQVIQVLDNRNAYVSFSELLLSDCLSLLSMLLNFMVLGDSILGSGQEVGPLLLKVPLVAKPGFSVKKGKAVSDKSHVFGDSEEIIDLGCGPSRRGVSTDSRLLNEVAVAELLLSFSLSFTHLL